MQQTAMLKIQLSMLKPQKDDLLQFTKNIVYLDWTWNLTFINHFTTI